MKKPTDSQVQPDFKPTRPGPAPTNIGALYDRHGPIPSPEAVEKDTDSAWALFQESVMAQDSPETVRDAPLPDSKKGFEPTDFAGQDFEATNIHPLKP
jgi:hypothetical protein